MTREEELTKHLKQFVKVIMSPQMSNMVMLAHIHGAEYSGPRVNMKRVHELLGMEVPDGCYGEEVEVDYD